VIRRLRAREEPAVIVQVDENLRIAIPCWMLDEACCRAMVVEKQPRIGIAALVQLRDLVDRQIQPSCENGAVRGPTTKGACNDNTNKDTKTGAGTTPGEV
jgi:hypothetical protein